MGFLLTHWYTHAMPCHTILNKWFCDTVGFFCSRKGERKTLLSLLLILSFTFTMRRVRQRLFAIPVEFVLMSTYCNHRIVEKPAHLTSWLLYTRTAATTTIERTCEQPNARWHCRHRRSCAVHNIQNVSRAGTHTCIQEEDSEKTPTHNVLYIVLSHTPLGVRALFTQTHTGSGKYIDFTILKWKLNLCASIICDLREFVESFSMVPQPLSLFLPPSHACVGVGIGFHLWNTLHSF